MYTISPPSFGQIAGEAAIDLPGDYFAQIKEEYQPEIPAIGQAQGIDQVAERQGQRPVMKDRLAAS